MNTDTRAWMETRGVSFFRELGVAPGQAVLDAGCGRGHYAVPAAITVGETGRVYAMDKDSGPVGVYRN
jgi:ubiquinone/menaquinone biosynthesis C-methylase UbiE